ncbi:MAG: flippase [Cytophagales bacterium]|nr:MAG: flippase [Cytophagales bacterium]
MKGQGSYWIKSGLFTILQRFSLLIFGFGSFFILIKILSKDDFGSWSLFLSITSLIEVARSGLVKNALVKHLTTAESKEHAKIITASLGLNVILTFCSIFLLFIGANFLSSNWNTPELEPMFYIYMITTLLLIPFFQFEFIQQANLDFQGIFFSNFVRQGLFFLAIILSYFFDYKLALFDLAKLQIVTALSGIFVSYFFVRKYIVLTKSIDWVWVKKLFNFGKYTFGTNVSHMIFSSVDQFLLGSLISKSAVASYNVALRVTNLVEVPTISIAEIVFPQSAKRMESQGKEGVKYLYEKSVGVIMAIVLPALVVVMVLPKFIITIIADERYLSTVPLLQITVLYTIFVPFARQFGTVLDSMGKPQINFYFVVIGAIINATLNYFFIKNFGIIGAAYGTLLSFTINFILNQIVLKKILNVEVLKVFYYMIEFYKEYWSKGLKYIKH